VQVCFPHASSMQTLYVRPDITTRQVTRQYADSQVWQSVSVCPLVSLWSGPCESLQPISIMNQPLQATCSTSLQMQKQVRRHMHEPDRGVVTLKPCGPRYRRTRCWAENDQPLSTACRTAMPAACCPQLCASQRSSDPGATLHPTIGTTAVWHGAARGGFGWPSTKKEKSAAHPRAQKSLPVQMGKRRVLGVE
jgi:hypothetical protein